MEWYYLSIPKLQWLNIWSLWINKQFHPILCNRCNSLSMLRAQLNRVSKRGPCGCCLSRNLCQCPFCKKIHMHFCINDVCISLNLSKTKVSPQSLSYKGIKYMYADTMFSKWLSCLRHICNMNSKATDHGHILWIWINFNPGMGK